jgi:uncharacterized protein YbaP (TraB family)
MSQKRTHPPAALVALLAFLLGASAWADTPVAPDPAPGQHDVFWSVQRNGAHAGYLLGTVHSEDPRVLEFTGDFLQRLERCDTYAMELVPDLPTMQRLLQVMQLPEGERLEPLLGETRYRAVREAVAAYGVPDDRLARMKPWAAMMTLSLPPPKTGLFLDFSLSLRAAGLGLEVTGLETLEEQLAFLERLTLEDQVALLDQALADHDQVQEVHDQLVDTYLRDDLAALQAASDEQMVSLEPEVRQWFQSEGIDARNRRMLENVLPLLSAGCTFVAVGALHLPGESGLISLLEGAGYHLSPLPSPFTAVQAESALAPAQP